MKLLVTIGGDDTASTANRLTNYLHNQDIEVAHIHVPKTIDNDLPLPDRNPTFGFHTAKTKVLELEIRFMKMHELAKIGLLFQRWDVLRVI